MFSISLTSAGQKMQLFKARLIRGNDLTSHMFANFEPMLTKKSLSSSDVNSI